MYKQWGPRQSEKVARVFSATNRRLKEMQGSYREMSAMMINEDTNVKPQMFQYTRRSGDKVFRIKNLSKQYTGGNNEIINALDLKGLEINISFGDRLYVYGSNGAGKSTLLRLLARSIASDHDFLPTEGVIEAGSSIDLGYFSPDLVEVRADSTVLRYVSEVMGVPNEQRIRTVLMYWGIPYEQQNATVGTLSKGERTQLELAKLMIRDPNLLVLDEPTMNLSQKLVSRLLDSLKDYKGTIILVSHDRRFVPSLKLNKRLNIEEKKLVIL